MLRRANTLVTRARERIRAAAEHDPHAWPLRDDDRAILVHDEDVHDEDVHDEDPDVPPPSTEDDGSTRPPLGSPEPGAPDLDVGGVSGPPRGGSPHRDDRQRGRDGGADGTVPSALRIAAAWSWRLILVGGAVYLVLRMAGVLLEVFVPVLVALLLAALLQPGAAGLIHRRWPRSLAALAMLLVGLAVVDAIITLVRHWA